MQCGVPFNLPPEALINIAFYIEAVDNLFAFLEALRPAYDLGILEHLWQLRHQLHWKKHNLWPRLSLKEVEESSLVHLKPIISHYAEVAVGETTQVEWFCPLIDSKSRITWAPRESRFDPTCLAPWKSFRITRIAPWFKDCNQPTQVLLSFPHLEEITCNSCSTHIAEAIFKFAATSSNLRRLRVGKEERSRISALITPEMADNIMQWNNSHPIEVFRLWNFRWSSQELRDLVIASVLENAALKEFSLRERLFPNPHSLFNAEYNRNDSSLKFTLRDGSSCQRSPVDELNNIMAVFVPLLRTKITKFNLSESWMNNFHNSWTTLAPKLQGCHLETVNLELATFTVDDALALTQDARELPTLQVIGLLSLTISFEAARTLLEKVSHSVNSVSIRFRAINQFSNTQWQNLENIAIKRSIHFDYSMNDENNPKARHGCWPI
ncbi:hypothetical protein LEN26_013991 [Aphanomyces euteiches]|nr:hypothetical protein AeMF1_021387 [Aphanomyces euteiches]KAH9109611.1 hypothetical protein LEN26_013991 [Aphanomyces euteiches]KAH9111313.1 hypothetical protein AeMF1_014132 [Aphanomyces euteiches]KAH9119889.1 hypothetical protein AeMF1_007681 [Aphanomyces euteiches]KAH9183430.1 hypothetical protein AeNC1_014593 [Aphanomyces euteiches]